MVSRVSLIRALVLVSVGANTGCAFCEDIEALPKEGTVVRSLTVGDGCAAPRPLSLRSYSIAQLVDGVPETQRARASGGKLPDVIVDPSGEERLPYSPGTYLFCVDEPRLTSFVQATCVSVAIDESPMLLIVLETEGETRMTAIRGSERRRASGWLMASFLDVCLDAGAIETSCSGTSRLGADSCLTAALAIGDDDCTRREEEALLAALECRAGSSECTSLPACPSIPCVP